jgi:hypothetical protein
MSSSDSDDKPLAIRRFPAGVKKSTASEDKEVKQEGAERKEVERSDPGHEHVPVKAQVAKGHPPTVVKKEGSDDEDEDAPLGMSQQ